MNGKGSTRRPRAIAAAEERANWQRTFGAGRSEPSRIGSATPLTASSDSMADTPDDAGDASRHTDHKLYTS